MDYLQKAQRRAARRKSAWNLLLIPLSLAFLLALFFLLVSGLEIFHGYFHPAQTLSNSNNSIAAIFSVMPLFFIALPFGFISANTVAWLIRPLRRIFDAEAEPHPRTDFLSSQVGLLKLGAMASIVCLPISLFSAALSWSAP